MDKSWENLPTLDWELAKKLAGNQMDLAEEMVSLFIAELGNEMQTITQSANQKKYTVLCQQVHRLHGAAAFCGVPRFKKILGVLETQVRKNELDDLPVLLGELNTEAHNLVTAYQR